MLQHPSTIHPRKAFKSTVIKLLAGWAGCLSLLERLQLITASQGAFEFIEHDKLPKLTPKLTFLLQAISSMAGDGNAAWWSQDWAVKLYPFAHQAMMSIDVAQPTCKKTCLTARDHTTGTQLCPHCRESLTLLQGEGTLGRQRSEKRWAPWPGGGLAKFIACTSFLPGAFVFCYWTLWFALTFVHDMFMAVIRRSTKEILERTCSLADTCKWGRGGASHC